MIRRGREGWSDYALGRDARRAFQPRGRIRQVFLAIGAVKFLHVLGVGIHNQQMSGHGTFLSDWMLSNESHIGSAAALMRYGILTASDQSLGCCGRGYSRLAPRSVSSSRSTDRWQRASFSQ